MAKNKKGDKLTIRPYARLLTMLGEQLIKNEKVALIELIKNSYDADSSWVQVRFVNFRDFDESGYLEFTDKSYIEIEDDGDGMSMSTIENDWMNPATASKLKKKNKGNNITTRKHRIIQGEKGIGRFAVLKLGSRVEIVSRHIEKNAKENYVDIDFSAYDTEFLEKHGKSQEIYLDEIEIDYQERKPEEIIPKKIIIQGVKKNRDANGTIIRISNLKGSWNQDKIEDIWNDTKSLENPFDEKLNKKEFTVDIQINGKSFYKQENDVSELFKAAPVRVKNGYFNSKNMTVKLNINNTVRIIELSRLSGITEFKKQFCDKKGNIIRDPECGSFSFEIYVFDLTSKASPKYLLEKAEKERVIEHRIYLYRDGIRVYPYGDPNDDWLGIDILRGTGRAGDYLSNDQIIGYVGITQEENRKLKDKTNREGLIEIGNAFQDFRVMLQSILGYIKSDYNKYREKLKQSDVENVFKQNKVNNQLEELLSLAESKNDTKSINTLKAVIQDYTKEKKYLSERVEITEDLAGVGLAVETTSHDIMVMISRAKDTIDMLLNLSVSENMDSLLVAEELQKLRGQVSFVEDRLEGIQPVFRSSKRKTKEFRIKEVIETVKKYFDLFLNNSKINVEIEQVGPPLVIKTVEAVLLQTFINLFDNAIYWLNTVDIKNKEIKITLNGNTFEVIFSDNGPGIMKDDIPLVFNIFYSTKGLKGRGLGLYIVRQLLERYDFGITYIDRSKDKVLSGANFLINFDNLN